MKNLNGCYEGYLHVQKFEQHKLNTTYHGQPLTKFPSQTFTLLGQADVVQKPPIGGWVAPLPPQGQGGFMNVLVF